MTREDQLKLCKICNHKIFDLQKGIICNITNDIAKFSNTCENFSKDVSIKNADIATKPLKPKFTPKSRSIKIKYSEKITQHDVFICLATTIFSILILRFVYFASFDIYEYYLFSKYQSLTLILGSSFIIFSRKRDNYPMNFFSDLKYKLMFAFFYSSIHLLYASLFLEMETYFMPFIGILLLSFLISMIIGITFYTIKISFNSFKKLYE